MAVVAGSPVRPIHPLGAFMPCPAGEWGGKTNYGEWIRNNAQDARSRSMTNSLPQFNPVKFDAEGLGPDGQGRRDEVHRHHFQAS
ncbi:MAG: hypothetical protein MZV63_46880 [Marinilabiliales bacterium]|nr:hypothetical protein [Marinilabiliales bacterium]